MRGYLLGFIVVLAAGCGSVESAAELTTRNEVADHATKWVAESDQNRDRRLDKVEWQVMMRRDFPNTAEEVRQRWGDRDFAEYDSNGDGFVEAEELTALGLEGFDCMDTDRDGRLSSSERMAAANPACPSRTIVE